MQNTLCSPTAYLVYHEKSDCLRLVEIFSVKIFSVFFITTELRNRNGNNLDFAKNAMFTRLNILYTIKNQLLMFGGKILYKKIPVFSAADL